MTIWGESRFFFYLIFSTFLANACKKVAVSITRDSLGLVIQIQGNMDALKHWNILQHRMLPYITITIDLSA